MDYVTLYVYVKSPGYGEKLVRFMENRQPELYVELWTDREQIEKAKEHAWVLTDVKTGWKSTECQFLYLVKEKSENSDEIHMFQSVEGIYQDIRKRLFERETKEQERKEKKEKRVWEGKRFYGFFSPCRGEEREIMMLNMAGELSRELNVLVLSFSPWSLLGDLVERQGGKRGEATLSRLLLCGEKEAFANRIREQAYSLGTVDFIEPVIQYQDLMDFRKEEVSLLCEYLQQQTNYDVIFVEIETLWDYAFLLLSQMEEIRIPSGDLPWEDCRWQRMLEFARVEEVLDFSEKIREIQVTDSMREDVKKMWVERCDEYEQYEKTARKGARDSVGAGTVRFGNKGRNTSTYH